MQTIIDHPSTVSLDALFAGIRRAGYGVRHSGQGRFHITARSASIAQPVDYPPPRPTQPAKRDRSAA